MLQRAPVLGHRGEHHSPVAPELVLTPWASWWCRQWRCAPGLVRIIGCLRVAGMLLGTAVAVERPDSRLALSLIMRPISRRCHCGLVMTLSSARKLIGLGWAATGWGGTFPSAPGVSTSTHVSGSGHCG